MDGRDCRLLFSDHQVLSIDHSLRRLLCFSALMFVIKSESCLSFLRSSPINLIFLKQLDSYR